MNKKYLIGTVVIGVLAIALLIWFLNSPKRQLDTEIQATTKQLRDVSTEALRSLVDTANRLSGIQSGAVFNFEIDSLDGKFANFGIVRYRDEVRADTLIEEHAVIFREIGAGANGTAEVDYGTVIAMHRTPVDFGGEKSVTDLEATARQFLKSVYPDFTNLELTLEFEPVSKTNPKGSNYFFRWNDKRFALPKGVEMDLNPFIQVGINSVGFIFSYDNTVQLYSNLSMSDLKKICAFVEMPQTDNSTIDPEQGIVRVYFNEYEPFQNRYLVLPYEPETDFAGCSESAKVWLEHIRAVDDRNRENGFYD